MVILGLGHLGDREAIVVGDTEQSAPDWLLSTHIGLRLGFFLAGHCFIRMSGVKQS